MNVKYEMNLGQWLIIDGFDNYESTENPEPSGRVLDGSYDHDYSEEWIGYGHVNGVPVAAIYLFGEDDILEDEELDYRDWDTALKRLVVQVDELSDDEFAALRAETI